jgi:hypothetical protein
VLKVLLAIVLDNFVVLVDGFLICTASVATASNSPFLEHLIKVKRQEDLDAHLTKEEVDGFLSDALENCNSVVEKDERPYCINEAIFEAFLLVCGGEELPEDEEQCITAAQADFEVKEERIEAKDKAAMLETTLNYALTTCVEAS